PSCGIPMHYEVCRSLLFDWVGRVWRAGCRPPPEPTRPAGRCVQGAEPEHLVAVPGDDGPGISRHVPGQPRRRALVCPEAQMHAQGAYLELPYPGGLAPVVRD